MYAPQGLLDSARGVRTFMAIMGCDILRDEADTFLNRLQNWHVSRHYFDSYPHMALAMQGILGTSLLVKMRRFLENLALEGEDDEGDVLEMTAKMAKWH